MSMTVEDVLRPVLTDLTETGAPVPVTRFSRHDEAGHWTVMLSAQDGTRQGFVLNLAEQPERLIAEASDRVQEWVFDQLWGTRSTNWPPCPLHPKSHPLNAGVIDGKAMWICPTGPAIAEIGNLTTPRSRDEESGRDR
ncbi:hypothetical protein [Sinomonas albida]|uniref:hypothetical protein n=1 Tax=Sinomonas albida TaxID=369942 RepID=UPI003016AAB7